MKNLFFLILLFTGIVKAQIVNIPDANFKAYLLTANTTNAVAHDNFGNPIVIDTNGNGEIEVSEALNVKTLYFYFQHIYDLTGIQNFTNLKEFYGSSLHVNANDILLFSTLNLEVLSLYNNAPVSGNYDVSGITTLKILHCESNYLTSLNISGLQNLRELYCDNNGLQVLNLSTNPNLEIISCYQNNLSNLNLLPLTHLKKLECSNNNNLSSLNLNSLSNLTEVISANCSLSNINLTGLAVLEKLDCNHNQITTLDLTGITTLNYLDCNNNQINTLGLTALPTLNYLDCSYNNISSLNPNSNTNLTWMDCSSNSLTSLIINNLINLQYLSGNFNQLQSLDFSNLVNITQLGLSNNLFASLNVSNLIYLTYFNCSNNPQLTHLFIKNGINYNLLNFDYYFLNDFNLQYVCTDDNKIAALLTYFQSNNILNVQVNSYCTFPPGGDYNTIAGTTHFDSNNNGCDAFDPFINNIRIDINDGTNNGATFSNNTGNYAFNTHEGNFILTPVFENPTYFSFSPTNAVVNFPIVNNSISTQNFCITSDGVHPDLEVVIIPIVRARPGFDALYKIVYKNKGNQILTGNINLAFDDAKTDFVSATPHVDSQSISLLTWNYSNLLPFETRAINFTLNINSPTESPAVNSGDILSFAATIDPVTGDEIPVDNAFSIKQTVVNSLDPNDKTCLEGNTISPSEIGNYVHYNINFENVGTEDATNIVVKDIIDTTKFDINSLQVMYASHEVNPKISGNIVEFVFQGINLPPSAVSPIGGHGNVLFKIKTKPTLVVGDIITNTANIFFDYNAPITTNEAKTTFALLNTADFVRDISIKVYPNPAKNNITISAKNNIKSLQLFDVQGRILQTVIENKNTVKLDVSNKANGIYFLKTTTEDGSSVEKVVKE